MKRQRSFLKWAGNKYNCLQQVIQALPEGRRFVEPFTGSGVVFMNTNFSSYVLGEFNQDLVNLFQTLKQQGESFIIHCKKYFHPDYNCAEQYYVIRNHFNQLKDVVEKSAYFIYLNRHGYNGLCRYNSKGVFNVPFGLYEKPYFPEESMMLFHQKSINAQFLHQDFRATFAMAERGDVIYCDPPYAPLVADKNCHTAYTHQGFTLEDQLELAQLAEEAAARDIPVVISNHDTPVTRQYYKNAEIKSFLVPRYISCKQREPAKELLAVFK